MTAPESKRAGFTPGPWEVVGLSGFGGPYSIRMAYTDDKTFYGVRQIHRKADANAIAAIPEMYATLIALEKWFDTDQEILDALPEAERTDNARQLAKIRAAIARARGTQ